MVQAENVPSYNEIFWDHAIALAKSPRWLLALGLFAAAAFAATYFFMPLTLSVHFLILLGVASIAASGLLLMMARALYSAVAANSAGSAYGAKPMTSNELSIEDASSMASDPMSCLPLSDDNNNEDSQMDYSLQS